jgi:Protein of unknown function (DUF4019)
MTGDTRDNSDKAVAAARTIMTLAGENKVNTIWDQHTAAWYKSKLDKTAFLQNLSFGRKSVGGPPQSVKLQSVKYAKGETGLPGDVFTVSFESQYAVGKFYERIVVLKETDGEFRLVALSTAPAPKD